VSTGASRADGPGRASLGRVCPCCLVRSTTAMARGGGSFLPHGYVVAAPVPLSQLSSSRPHVGERSETAKMIAKIMVAQVGGWQVGWSNPDRLGWWFFEGREKSLSACSALTWSHLRVSLFIPKGPRVYPFLTPSAYRGNPRTCPGNSVIIVAFLLEGVAW
jgi:hypothetical protein